MSSLGLTSDDFSQGVVSTCSIGSWGCCSRSSGKIRWKWRWFTSDEAPIEL